MLESGVPDPGGVIWGLVHYIYEKQSDRLYVLVVEMVMYSRVIYRIEAYPCFISFSYVYTTRIGLQITIFLQSVHMNIIDLLL